MKEFTASDGTRVRFHPLGEIEATAPDGRWIAAVGYYFAPAVQEFLRAAEDAQLEQWRWHGGCLVRRRGNGLIVLDEATWGVRVFDHPEHVPAKPSPNNRYTLAARAFLDAHPEQMPWHSASHGELWELTVGGVADVYVAHTETPPWPRFVPLTSDARQVTICHADITAGRRVWPEVQQ